MEREAFSPPYIGKRGRRYYALWYDPATRRTRRASLGTTVAAEAEKNFAAWLLDPASRLQLERPDVQTVEAGLDAYLREHVAKECADPKRQEGAAAHLKAFFTGKLFREVGIPQSRAYAAARRAGTVNGSVRKSNLTVTNATLRRELVVLVAAANHARKWKRITAADMPSVELPTLDQAVDEDGIHGEALHFTKEQVQALFEIAGEAEDQEMARYLRLLYYTAARRRSIENLTVGQIRLERRKISLATPGKKQTKKRQPVVPIFDAILDDCKALIDGKEPGDRIFRPRDFYKEFNLLCRALEFKAPHHPHMMRHSRATHLLQDGKTIYDVAALLGDTIKTVEANYSHHAHDDLRESLE